MRATTCATPRSAPIVIDLGCHVKPASTLATRPLAIRQSRKFPYFPQLNCASNQSGSEPGSAAICCVRPVATSMA